MAVGRTVMKQEAATIISRDILPTISQLSAYIKEVV